MYHRKKGRKLGRRADHRRAMLRNLAGSLVEHGRIETTVTRAKEVRRKVERLVTIAKRGDLHARRLLISRLGGNGQTLAAKLIDEIAPKYAKRPGGYTRIIRSRDRSSDAAPMAFIEFVEEEMPKRKRKTKPAAKPRSGRKAADGSAPESPAANAE